MLGSCGLDLVSIGFLCSAVVGVVKNLLTFHVASLHIISVVIRMLMRKRTIEKVACKRVRNLLKPRWWNGFSLG